MQGPNGQNLCSPGAYILDHLGKQCSRQEEHQWQSLRGGNEFGMLEGLEQWLSWGEEWCQSKTCFSWCFLPYSRTSTSTAPWPRGLFTHSRWRRNSPGRNWDTLREEGSLHLNQCLLEFSSPSGLVGALQSPELNIHFSGQNAFLHHSYLSKGILLTILID